MRLASIPPLLGLFGLAALAPFAARGQSPEETIVYIECSAGGEVSRGSGVIVSPEGHVLTAGHVVPDGASCQGSVGVADPNLAARLIVQPTLVAVDAALLRFARPGEYPFASYCPVETSALRREIVVAGFPGRSETGAISYRQGILSTVTPNARGLLETDGQTVAGMSGGPVYSKNMAGFLGIVAGADFAPDGTVSFYGIVPAAFYADALGLAESPRPCFRETALGPGGRWRTGDPPLRLDVPPGEGVCFLAEVFGEFNAPEDRIWVLPKDGGYEISGENRAGGLHGGEASCVWLN
jgi:hypothetical protein